MEDFYKINKDMKLWDFYTEAGKQLPFWQPNGALIRCVIEDFWISEHIKHDYKIVYTPHIANKNLWTKSGHNDRYSERMFSPIIASGEYDEYILRPMNCPFHILLYNSDIRSYKELPIRFAELGTVYRKIPSGSYTEMFEVRGFTQDDAHIFLESEPEKVRTEISNLLQFTIYFIRDIFKIEDFKIIRRLKPTNALGSDNSWKNAQSILQNVLEEKDLRYEDRPGEGIFYGPKIDFEIKDSHFKKEWICSTIQLDLVLGDLFNIKYVNKENIKETPLIIHRTILGSLERFIALLISRTNGHLPLWLIPCQVLILPIDGSDYQINHEYAKYVKTILDEKLSNFKPRIKVCNLRATVSDTKKMAISERIPFFLTTGGNERMTKELSVMSWNGKFYGNPRTLTIDQLVDEFKIIIKNRT